MEFAAAAAGPSFSASVSRKASVAGSLFGGSSSGQAGRRLIPDFEFSLGAAKVKVLKALEDTLPAPFVRFYSSPLFDRLLHGLVLYFCALFQHELLCHMAERASRPAHLEGCNPQLLSARLRELQEELASRGGDLSGPYCELILKHSSYKNQQQDKRFFESLYAALTAVLHEAFERLGRQAALEQEVGRLFRGKHFNAAARRHGPQRSVDSMTVMQLWEVKNDTHNRALHAQLISSLFEKAPTLSVQVAAVSNTPLVSQAVSSPMVARSLLADPAERDALLALPYSRAQHKRGDKGSARRQAGAARAEEAAAGSSPRAPTAAAPVTAAAAGRPLLQSNSSISKATPAAAAAGGPRTSSVRPFQGVVASLPEAAGLPYDENFAYLCLLRRSVLYGPTMGLQTAPQPAVGGGRLSMMSLTGSAAAAGMGGGGLLPGSLSTSNSVVFRT